MCSNIDSRIRQAETEYQLEREETNLLNLHEEKRCLVLRLSSNGANDLGGNVAPNQQDASLFRSVNLLRERPFELFHQSINCRCRLGFN